MITQNLFNALACCEQCTLQKQPKIRIKNNPQNPTYVFIGEAPGALEIREGSPFVGKSKQLLQQILKHVGIDPADVYTTYLCLCKLPQNKKLKVSEIKACSARLEAELNDLKPKYIVAMGGVVGKTLFADFKNTTTDRGFVMPTITGHQGMVINNPASVLFPKGDTILPTIIQNLKKLLRYNPEMSAQNQTDVFIIDTSKKMKQLITRLIKLSKVRTVITYDWETTGLNPRIHPGFCLGFSWKVGTAVVIPMNLIKQHTADLANAMQLPNLKWCAFNAQFDAAFNKAAGLPPLIHEDPMLMHYMLDERPQQRSLENLSVSYCDAPKYESDMLLKYDCTKADMIEKIPLEIIYEYCGKDVDYTLRLYQIFEQAMASDAATKSITWVYRNLLIPASRAFVDIKTTGLWVDQDKLTEITTKYVDKKDTLEKEIKKLTHPEFNPNSHIQVQKFLWDNLQLTEPDIFNRKPRSADKNTREALLLMYPDQVFVVKLHQYKTLYTLLSRYLLKFPQFIQDDDRIRGNIHLDRTETGRLSITSPPLHQIPRESDVRTIFGTPPGYQLIQADYSQVEIRMPAHIARDKKLTALLNQMESEGTDFHSTMASRSFKVPLAKVTKELRQSAKPLSFGVLYQMSDFALADQTNLSLTKAKEVVAQFKQTMPGVMCWIEQLKKSFRKTHRVSSMWGRQRRFPLITTDNVKHLQREAINMPIQSAASDLNLWSLIELNNIFKNDTAYTDVSVVLTVHDSILVECPDAKVAAVVEIMRQVMTTPPFKTDVPFPVEIKVGRYWGEGIIYDPKTKTAP